MLASRPTEVSFAPIRFGPVVSPLNFRGPVMECPVSQLSQKKGRKRLDECFVAQKGPAESAGFKRLRIKSFFPGAISPKTCKRQVRPPAEVGTSPRQVRQVRVAIGFTKRPGCAIGPVWAIRERVLPRMRRFHGHIDKRATMPDKPSGRVNWLSLLQDPSCRLRGRSTRRPPSPRSGHPASLGKSPPIQ